MSRSEDVSGCTLSEPRVKDASATGDSASENALGAVFIRQRNKGPFLTAISLKSWGQKSLATLAYSSCIF